MRGLAAAAGLWLLFTASAARAATAVFDLKAPQDVKQVLNDDGVTQTTFQGTVPAVQTGGVEGNQYLYLDVRDDLFQDSKAVWVRVEYFDRGTDTFTVEYDAVDDPYRIPSPNPREKFDTRRWTQQTFKLADFNLKGQQEGGSDLRINDQGDGPEIIRRVIITDEDPEWIELPKNDPANPIIIDGKKSDGEWDGAFSVTLDQAQLDATPGAPHWNGPEEFSGTYSYKWDEQGLYILGEVTDATPRLNDAIGPNYWNGDGLEQFIGLDQSNPGRTSYREGTDFQVVIAMGETPAWAVLPSDTPDKGPIPAANAAVANTNSPKGYLFELLLPWTLLKADAKVTEGQGIGWSMLANNSTELPSSQQVAMSPSGRRGAASNPSVWATAVLAPQHRVELPPAAGP